MVAAVRRAHDGPKDLPGYCCLLTAAADEGEDQATATLRFAADEVVRLHERVAGVGNRRARPHQRHRRAVDFRIAPPKNRGQRGGRPPVDRLAGGGGRPFPVGAGRSSGRHGGAVPHRPFADCGSAWGLRTTPIRPPRGVWPKRPAAVLWSRATGRWWRAGPANWPSSATAAT